MQPQHKNRFFAVRVLKQQNRFHREVVASPSGRYSELNYTWSWSTCSSWPHFRWSQNVPSATKETGKLPLLATEADT